MNVEGPRLTPALPLGTPALPAVIADGIRGVRRGAVWCGAVEVRQGEAFFFPTRAQIPPPSDSSPLFYRPSVAVPILLYPPYLR